MIDRTKYYTVPGDSCHDVSICLANFFFNASAIIEAGSWGLALGFILRNGVPPGDLKIVRRFVP